MHSVDLQGSSYQNPQAILNSSESTQASGLNLFPSSYMSTGVGGGKKKVSNKKTKKGGDCGCSKLFSKGGKKMKKSMKKRGKKSQKKTMSKW